MSHLFGHVVTFADACLDQADYLTDLGMRSNAIYQYRTVTDEEARAVFLVSEWHINNGVIRLMIEDDKIIGFYGLAVENGVNILSHFFLEPAYIGRGYGKLLFIEAMRVAKEELYWDVLQWESDPNAAWFYAKMGAEPIAENICPLNPQLKAPVFSFQP